MSDGGKGSSPRPFSVSNQEYSNRWDIIFGRELNDETKVEETVDNQEETVYNTDK